jgi:hypothetical protein
MMRYLRKRGWVVFYLEEQNRTCVNGECWMKLYQFSNAPSKSPDYKGSKKDLYNPPIATCSRRNGEKDDGDATIPRPQTACSRTSIHKSGAVNESGKAKRI